MATRFSAISTADLEFVAADSTPDNGNSRPGTGGKAADLNAAREAYFANAVGRTPLPPRSAYVPVTPRKGTVTRKQSTGDLITDVTNNNMHLKTRPIEFVESLISLMESIVSYLVSKQERLPELLHRTEEGCKALDGEYRWVLPKGFTTADVIREAQLTLTEKDIANRLERPDHAPNSSLQTVLDDLASGRKLSRVAAFDARDVCRTVDPHIDSTAVVGASLPAGPTISQALMGLYEFFHTDPTLITMEEARKTEAARDRLKKLIAIQKQDVEEHLADGRMMEAEDSHKTLLNLQVELLELLAARYAQLDLANEDANSFAEDLANLYKDTDRLLNDFRNDKMRGKNDVEEDIKKCEELKKKQDEKESDLTRIYEENERELYPKLRDNEKRQMQIMAEMLGLAKQLQSLSETRKMLLASHIRAKEDYERDKYYIRELKDRAEDHIALLGRIGNYYTNELITADNMDHYNKTMQEKLKDKDWNNGAGELRDNELDDLLRAYRDYVANSSDLLTKKQHRLDTLERQVRLAELHRDTVRDSLDPDKPRYETELSRLSQLMRDTEGIMLLIEGQQDSTEQLVKKPLDDHASALAAKGETFVHPAVEYADIVVTDRRSFVDRTLRFVEDEERVVEKKKEALTRLKTRTDEEQIHHIERSAQKRAQSRQHAIQ